MDDENRNLERNEFLKRLNLRNSRN